MIKNILRTNSCKEEGRKVVLVGISVLLYTTVLQAPYALTTCYMLRLVFPAV